MGTMKPEFSSSQPAEGWEAEDAAFMGCQTGEASANASPDYNCKSTFGMGLAGTGVPDHSYIPRAHALLLQHLVETHRAKLAYC